MPGVAIAPAESTTRSASRSMHATVPLDLEPDTRRFTTSSRRTTRVGLDA